MIDTILLYKNKIEWNNKSGFLGRVALSRAGKGRGLRGTCNEVSSREKPRFGVGNFFNVKKVAYPYIRGTRVLP